MKKLLTLLVAVLSIGTMSCSNAQDGSGSAYKNVNYSLFEEALQSEEGTLLDVRTPEEVAKGSIEGATHINIYDEDFKEQAAELDKSKPVYVYCKSGGRSSRACKQLIGLGFSKVYNLDGGITAWKAANKPIVKP